MTKVKNETIAKAPNKKHFTEVWGDTVVLNELFYSSILGIALTMIMFLVGSKIFLSMDNIDVGLAKGYSLLVGIVGCVGSAVISAKLFKPKRIVDTKSEVTGVEEVIKAAGMTVEQEAKALATVDPQIIAELEDLEMYSLLALIPENSPNYKPEYKLYGKEANK